MGVQGENAVAVPPRRTLKGREEDNEDEGAGKGE
jgi:hypothetical protein